MDYGKLNFSVALNPTSAYPTDPRAYFETYASAQAAAAGAVEVGSSDGVYYIGHPVVVVENGKASMYVIQPDKTLAPVGTGGGGDFPYTLGATLKVVDNVLDVNTADDVQQDNTLPITSAAVYQTVGNIEILLGTI